MLARDASIKTKKDAQSVYAITTHTPRHSFPTAIDLMGAPLRTC